MSRERYSREAVRDTLLSVRRELDATTSDEELRAVLRRLDLLSPEPEPSEERVGLDALHIPHEAWERWRESLEWHYPSITIVRLPDTEPGIRSWGITPRELHPPRAEAL